MALPSKELPDQALDALIVRERTRIVAPLTDWRDLSMAMRQEGLIRDSAGQRQSAPREFSAEPTPRGPGWLRATGRWTLRAATYAAVLGVGVVAGRGMTFGQDLITQIQYAISDSTGSHGGSSVHVGGTRLTSTSDARRTLIRAQTDYEQAAAFLAAKDSEPLVAGEPDIYRDRLTGLDEMTAASLSALKEAPRDPLLNQYFLSVAAAREATLQQLGNALPTGATLTSF